MSNINFFFLNIFFIKNHITYFYDSRGCLPSSWRWLEPFSSSPTPPSDSDLGLSPQWWTLSHVEMLQNHFLRRGKRLPCASFLGLLPLSPLRNTKKNMFKSAIFLVKCNVACCCAKTFALLNNTRDIAKFLKEAVHLFSDYIAYTLSYILLLINVPKKFLFDFLSTFFLFTLGVIQ